MILGTRVVTALFGVALLGIPAIAQDTATAEKSKKTLDTKRDVRKTGPTADDAKNNKTDVQLMADIRKAVVDDKSLSTYAHNAKIIVKKGKVTLRGNVRTEDEKKTIESKATEVAGAGNVTNNLKIVPEKSKASDKTKG